MAIIPQYLLNKYDEFTQHFLDDFGTDCSLVYHLSSSSVENFPTSSQRNSLGIIPSNNGIVRGNEKTVTTEITETVRLRLYWTQEDFKKISSIVIPQGAMVAYGLLTDLHKIERARYLIVYPNSTPDHREWKFERMGEPIIHGLTDKEFISFWQRV